jgi:hypothetical protein
MGKEAATVLFKALGGKNFKMEDERVVIPSALYIRNSTNSNHSSIKVVS